MDQQLPFTIHYLPFTIYLSSAAGDVAVCVCTSSGGGCVGKGNVLHAQVGQQPFEDLLLLRQEVAARLLLEHSQDVDPVLAQFQIDLTFVRYRVLHHSQR